MNLRGIVFTATTAFTLILSACAAESMPTADQTGMNTVATTAEQSTMDTMGDESMDSNEMETEDMKESDDMAPHDDDGMAESDDMAPHDDDGMAESDDMASHDDDDMAESDDMASHDDDGMAESDDMSSHDDDGMVESDDMASHDDTMMGGHTITLDITGLEDLGSDVAYEGWLIIDGAPVSTGTFTVDSDGMLSNREFHVDAGAQMATSFILTVEPAPDDNPAPGALHLLGGDLVDGAAQLSIAHPAALGNDFAAAGSTYIIGLGAPASATEQNNYRNGIWFNKLDLPQLPTGWIYEGWVVGQDGPITTGRFADPSTMDSDGSGPYAGGPGTGPGFPGQDYLSSPIDLTAGYAAVISIEPQPDTSPAPFTLKPLVDAEIEDVGDHGSQSLENRTDSFPTGTVVLAGR